jgi:intracellular sulfur oxidation DsrE/DsrF family protein
MKQLFASFFVFVALAVQAAAGDQIKVVYHNNEGADHAPQMLRNIRNHLDSQPGVKIVVVSHALGVDFLVRGAKDKDGNPFQVTVQDLVSKGVEFRTCAYTLKVRKIDPKTIIEEATLVPSGVAEVARLQAQEGYAYLKP